MLMRQNDIKISSYFKIGMIQNVRVITNLSLLKICSFMDIITWLTFHIKLNHE